MTIRRLLALSGGFALLLLTGACDEDSLAGPRPPDGALRFVEMETGYLHACGLTPGGRAYCWGGNSTGALGDGTFDQSNTPVAVATSRRFADIDVGAANACGIEDDGTPWCWGHNDEGQLGNGSRTSSPEPVQVVGEHRFVSITLGHDHACGLTEEGVAWCWGDDTSGQLGDGDEDGPSTRSTIPVRVAFDSPFRAITAGYYQTCGLDENAHAWCWGTNYVGQIGDGTFEERYAPVAVAGGHTFSSLALGDGVTCGLANGEALCWGSNRFFEMARAPVTLLPEPVALDVGNVDFVQPAVGAETIAGSRPYVCAVRSDGRVSCWGGAVPNLRSVDAPEPELLDDEILFDLISPGPQFVCGLRRDGYAYCAGAAGSGQLGNGDEDPRSRMTPVAAPR